jgi:hypothetical protein
MDPDAVYTADPGRSLQIGTLVFVPTAQVLAMLRK